MHVLVSDKNFSVMMNGSSFHSYYLLIKESLKDEKPCVEWNMRCYHYEKRKLLCLLLMVDLWKWLFNSILKKKKRDEEKEGQIQLFPSIFTKKVVTHQASKYYTFNR